MNFGHILCHSYNMCQVYLSTQNIYSHVSQLRTFPSCGQPPVPCHPVQRGFIAQMKLKFILLLHFPHSHTQQSQSAYVSVKADLRLQLTGVYVSASYLINSKANIAAIQFLYQTLQMIPCLSFCDTTCLATVTVWFLLQRPQLAGNLLEQLQLVPLGWPAIQRIITTLGLPHLILHQQVDT